MDKNIAVIGCGYWGKNLVRNFWELEALSTSHPRTSDQYPQKAKRPSFSVLDNYHLRLLGMDDMRDWQEALKEQKILLTFGVKSGKLITKGRDEYAG